MVERRNRHEDALQIGVVELLLYNGYWPVHVPNQGKRSAVGHAMLVKMGLWPGFPDLIVFGREKSATIVCTIELKRPARALKRGGVSKAQVKPDARQLQTHAMLAERQIPTIVARSLDDVLTGMAALGQPMRARVMG